MENTRNYIQERDMFGHTINLNFDKSGDSHKTLIGGLMSILIKFAIFTYVFLRFKMMIFLEADDNTAEVSVALLEEDAFKDIRYDESNITIIHSIRK